MEKIDSCEECPFCYYQEEKFVCSLTGNHLVSAKTANKINVPSECPYKNNEKTMKKCILCGHDQSLKTVEIKDRKTIRNGKIVRQAYNEYELEDLPEGQSTVCDRRVPCRARRLKKITGDNPMPYKDYYRKKLKKKV